ncbi:hypothetical protein FSP39_015676 [Pinctada imbricata]|uniref:DJ-1/PfpI domain-containing protein n=1 Tax=Pinctada imbricata TaxID=66713 RepID=A0AA89BR27_PINIB|nr:hypothetical protein FSP39_015676 [Pinctada imbricata]
MTSGKPTGWYLPEVAHPYDVFTKAGYDITFVSPNGGKAPMDPGSYEAFKEDPSSKAFLKDHLKDLDNTLSPSQVSAKNYDAIVYAGGHGPMFDLPNNDAIAKLCAEMYEAGRVVGAVCHGTVGLLNVKLSNGEYMINGKEITSFTNSEEEAVKLMADMPFPLETKLIENGANFRGVENFKENVVSKDKRIVTGQNPASATGMATEIVKLLSSK